MKHIYKELDFILDNFKRVDQTIDFYPHKYNMEHILSDASLNEFMSNGDLEKASSSQGNDNRIVLDKKIFYKLTV